MISLGWLPVHERIQYSIGKLVYKALKNDVRWPTYLTRIIVVIVNQKSWLYMLELIVGFETKIEDNAVSKDNHYSSLCLELRN